MYNKLGLLSLQPVPAVASHLVRIHPRSIRDLAWTASRVSYNPVRWNSNSDAPAIDGPTLLEEQPARIWRSMALVSVATLSLGYLVGTSYPPSLMSQLVINSFLKRSSSAHLQPPPEDSPEAIQICSSIEAQLHELPIVKQLISKPDRWLSFRPFQTLARSQLTHSLTHSSLRGPGKFAIPPLVFLNKDKTESVAILHVGDLMCGHDGIVHGGLLATVCDEGLAVLALSNLPNKIGVTASLKLAYKKPVLASQFIVLRTWLPAGRAPSGRKAWADGRLENLAGDVLVEAESLFVEPKGAKFISNSQIKDLMKK
ncbi:hypothetical protein PCASD_03507 [Puccinia coronata f. sp. avenae]|uniref:Thioesterase domain-containing protein n=1 Tax=Puccinia coronata f. sp. avenae TaxID=200324 RepID=A0A2N5V7Z5_9BASI|nr:hypothetical protein PCASD_03507 [Puccinia coronata f. sp. avenae]